MLRFFRDFAKEVRGDIRISMAVQDFVASLEEAGSQVLGGTYKDGFRWSTKLEIHGAASGDQGNIGSLSPCAIEASAIQTGNSRVLALVVFLGEVYEQSVDIVASKQFASLEMLCAHVLRPFEWLAPAIFRLSTQYRLDVLPALHKVFALRNTMQLAAEVEPEPEPEPEPEAASTVVVRKFEVKAMSDRKFDIFINHCQASGQDQCGKLHLLLEAAGASVWYDMQAQDLTAEGMEEGVSESRCFLMFLSDNLMGRPFCQKEQRWGKLYDCKFIGVVEKDTRHNPADFGKEKTRAPTDLKHLLDGVEFIEYRRRDFEVEAMVVEILRRADVSARTQRQLPNSTGCKRHCRIIGATSIVIAATLLIGGLVLISDKSLVPTTVNTTVSWTPTSNGTAPRVRPNDSFFHFLRINCLY